jgi:sulfur-oxidizing protein SoxZ
MSTRTPAKGDIVNVKVMVTHPMETGMRKNAMSQLIPRNIITRFECSLADEPLMSWQLDTAVSQNPYLEFRFIAQKSGELKMRWLGEDGTRIEAVEKITVSQV